MADRSRDRRAAVALAALLLAAAGCGGAGSETLTVPDGSRVFFSRGDGTFAVRDLAGGRVQPLPGSATVNEAVWSPDGVRIAFSGSLGGREGIFVVTAPRGKPAATARLVAGAGAFGVRHPALGSIRWSADGRAVTFSVVEADPPCLFAIYRVGVDGSGLRQLVRISPRLGRRPSVDNAGLSPDGRDLLYVQWPQVGRLDDGVGPAALVRKPVDGAGESRTLVSGRPGEPEEFITDASWSPDGRSIAYVDDCWPHEWYGDCDLAVVDARTGAPRRLPPPAGVRRSAGDLNGLTYAWRPAHRTIVYAYDQSDDWVADSVRSAAVREASPGARAARLVTTIPCAWDACSAIRPEIVAVSGDGKVAVISAVSEQWEPAARELATTYLVDLANGALEQLAPGGLVYLAPESR